MYFRCADCHAATWIDRTPGRGCPIRSLRRVRPPYTVRPGRDLGPTLAEHYRRTLELSNECQIDMPSAYSILLGLLSREELQLLFDRPASPSSATPAGDGGGSDPPARPLAAPGVTSAAAPSTDARPWLRDGAAVGILDPPAVAPATERSGPAARGRALRGTAMLEVDPAYARAIAAGRLTASKRCRGATAARSRRA